MRKDGSVDWKEDNPKYKGTRYSKEGELGPLVGYQSCFTQNDQNTSGINSDTPRPMVCHFSMLIERKTKPVYKNGTDESNSRMIKPINNPPPENHYREKLTLLSQLVQLRIAFQQSAANKLIKNSHNEWWKNREENIIEGQCP